jgi:hypothetical protein
MPEGFPGSARKEHPRHELDACQAERDEQVPLDERPHVVHQREPEEKSGEGEPHSDAGRGMQREEHVIAKRLRFEFRSHPFHQRPDPNQRQESADDQLRNVHTWRRRLHER